MVHARAERFPELAAELVRLEVEVIVAANNPAVAAAQEATTTIPIVMVLATDPVRLGFVTSLARPAGNITGLTMQTPELAGKRLELLKEAVPNLTRVGVLWDPTEPGRRQLVKEAEGTAPRLGLHVQTFEVRNGREIGSAFEALTRARVTPEGRFFEFTAPVSFGGLMTGLIGTRDGVVTVVPPAGLAA
jgi:putative ABC transport system substrate-binding protein